MSIEDDIQLLDRIKTLNLLGREALRIIAIGAEARVVRGGDILFREGQDADSAYVVVSGSFQLTREDALSGMVRREPVSVGPGTLLGEMALITATRRPATAIATEMSNVLRIPRSIFMRTVESFPDVAVRIARELSSRLGETMTGLDSVRRQLEAIEGPPVDLATIDVDALLKPPAPRPKVSAGPTPSPGAPSAPPGAANGAASEGIAPERGAPGAAGPAKGKDAAATRPSTTSSRAGKPAPDAGSA
ncbi:cyclic nucleotide-binding domain-containing protein [Ancylobacter sp. 6x-1]|uniref:Cyclic nucleotide-binding domain-containing protein n=1 Tax=Ancylobacter crimeensis TaxID=2579147 RepID=A0ABT0DC24_9HYPH|nr:cyclic nucleotide-binding domain-containing protein [Ancylobacter crimeensis]MCK0197512.1 cyclic nucleotide-binding domain-containing protein [Ancylobacter crimeensis]